MVKFTCLGYIYICNYMYIISALRLITVIGICTEYVYIYMYTYTYTQDICNML